MKKLFLVFVMLIVSCTSSVPTSTSRLEWEDRVSNNTDIVITVMWESWCQYCNAELITLNEKYANEERITVIGLNLGEEQEIINDYVSEYGLTNIIMVQSEANRGGLPTTRVYIRQENGWEKVNIGPSPYMVGWGEGLDERLYKTINDLLSS